MRPVVIGRILYGMTVVTIVIFWLDMIWQITSTWHTEDFAPVVNVLNFLGSLGISALCLWGAHNLSPKPYFRDVTIMGILKNVRRLMVFTAFGYIIRTVRSIIPYVAFEENAPIIMELMWGTIVWGVYTIAIIALLTFAMFQIAFQSGDDNFDET